MVIARGRVKSALAAFAAVQMVALVAAAQVPNPEPSEADDPGVKLGRLRLRPSINVGYAFDSNVFLRDEAGAESGPGPTAAHRMHIAPSLRLTTAKDSPVQFSFGGGIDYRLYISDNQNVKNLSDLSANADLNVTFNPNGEVLFSILNNFRRTTAAPTVELPTPFNRDFNRVGARLGIQPGGKALTFDLYYYFNYDHFEGFGFTGRTQGQSNVVSLDNLSHDISLKARWKFLPKTAVTFDASGIIWRWDANSFANPNLFRTYVGLVGNLTSRFQAQARLGYGNSFHSSGESFNSVVGDFEVTYALARLSNIRFSYARDFAPTTWGNYFGSHQLALNVTSVLWRRLQLAASATYLRVGFNANPSQQQLQSSAATLLSADARSDNIFAASVSANVIIQKWLSFSTSYTFNTRGSNNGLQFNTTQGQALDRFGFAQHVFNAGLTAAY